MGKRVKRELAAAAASRAEEEKRKLGLEQESLQREKEGIVARQLGARRATLGRASAAQMGGSGAGLVSSPEQGQRARDIQLVALNETRAQQLLDKASAQGAQPAQLMGRVIDPLAGPRSQLAAAKEDVQRVNRGERPLLQEIKLPAALGSRSRSPFTGR